MRLSGPILAETNDAYEAAETATARTAAEAAPSAAPSAPKKRGAWAPTGDVRFPPAVALASAASLSLAQSPAVTDAGAPEVPGKAGKARTPQPPADSELAAILRGAPLLCVAFDAMEMDVGAPVKVAAK